MKAPPKLEKRRRATQRTRDKFFGKPFSWAEGRHCVKLAHYHLRGMGWRAPKLPKLPDIHSALAARKALKANGWANVEAMLDSILERIPPAAMLLGDLGIVPGDEGFESVVVCLGPHKLLGWLPDGSEAVIYDASFGELAGAWRVQTA